MADLADVEDTLVDFIVGILYPNGTAASSALGAMCRVFRGWPLPAGLNADLAAGIVNVTVYPSAAPARRLPTLPIVYSSQTAPSVLSATASANVVTFSGVPTHSHCVGVPDRWSPLFIPAVRVRFCERGCCRMCGSDQSRPHMQFSWRNDHHPRSLESHCTCSE